jgi:ATP/ADP translocase
MTTDEEELGTVSFYIAIVLTLIFIGLKLIGAVDWSWIAVTSPILLFISVWLGFIIICVGSILVIGLLLLFLLVLAALLAIFFFGPFLGPFLN